MADLPLADLRAQYRELQAQIGAAIARVLASGRFVNGPEKAAFEHEFASFVGCPHVVGVGNGTDAIALALVAAGIRPGDEVLLPANTFHATAEAVCMVGARPALVDVDPRTLQLDPAALAQAASEKTRAVIPVHLFGYPAALGEVLALAEQRGWVVIEDCAQAHATRLHGRHVGTFGAAGAFSFFPGKTLGAFGDGGAVTTSDADLAARVRCLGDHGRNGEVMAVGRNSRLDEIQAAALRLKLPRLKEWARRRLEIETVYRERAAGLGDLRFLAETPGAGPAPFNVVVRTARRDELLSWLRARGIQAKVHYPRPIHRLPAFAFLAYPPDAFPHATRACGEILSLPNFPEMTDRDISRVTEALTEFFRG